MTAPQSKAFYEMATGRAGYVHSSYQGDLSIEVTEEDEKGNPIVLTRNINIPAAAMPPHGAWAGMKFALDQVIADSRTVYTAYDQKPFTFWYCTTIAAALEGRIVSVKCGSWLKDYGTKIEQILAMTDKGAQAEAVRQLRNDRFAQRRLSNNVRQRKAAVTTQKRAGVLVSLTDEAFLVMGPNGMFDIRTLAGMEVIPTAGTGRELAPRTLPTNEEELSLYAETFRAGGYTLKL